MKRVSPLSAMALVLIALLVSPSQPSDANDVIVVCHQSLRDALQPWTEMRSREGLEIVFTDSEPTAAGTAANIKRLANEKTRYVLLVGDAPTIGQRIEKDNQTAIPTFYLASGVTVKHGSTPTYPSDRHYADLDSDGEADVSVGRLPVTEPQKLGALVNRIIAYEESSDFGPWRRTLQLTAGVGGFGPLVDGAIEAVTRTVLTSSLPPDAKPQIAYASPGHAFCPEGQPFRDCVMDRYGSGARFWIYAGHGRVDRLDLLKRSTDDSAGLQTSTGGSQPVWTVESLLDNESVSSLNANPSRGTIALLLACYSGAFDAPGDSLAERMLLTPGGPVSIIAASRLTMPYGNTRFGLSLLESIYQAPKNESNVTPENQRLGDILRLTQNRMASQAKGSATQSVVDGVAALISPAGSDLTDERNEHSGLYHLLGDPTLRLHQPVGIELEAKVQKLDAQAAKNSGDRRAIEVKIESPIGGTLIVSIDHPLGATSGAISTETRDSILQDPHGCTIQTIRLPINANKPLMAKLDLPADWTGPIVVRAFVQGERGWGTAATRELVY